jgi:hypothetical protein
MPHLEAIYLDDLTAARDSEMKGAAPQSGDVAICAVLWNHLRRASRGQGKLAECGPCPTIFVKA